MKNFFVRYKRVIFSVLLSVLLVGLVLFLCIAPYFLNERKSAHADTTDNISAGTYDITGYHTSSGIPNTIHNMVFTCVDDGGHQTTFSILSFRPDLSSIFYGSSVNNLIPVYQDGSWVEDYYQRIYLFSAISYNADFVNNSSKVADVPLLFSVYNDGSVPLSFRDASFDITVSAGSSYFFPLSSPTGYFAFTIDIPEGETLTDFGFETQGCSVVSPNLSNGIFRIRYTAPSVLHVSPTFDDNSPPAVTVPVQGEWTFNAIPVLPSSTLNQTVEFYSNESHYASFMVTSDSIYYVGGADDSHSMIAYKSSTGWAEIGLQSIDFGDSPQEVSEEFYNWLSDNAIYEGDVGSFPVNAGYYLFNKELTLPNDNYIIQIPFISNGVKFRQIEVSSSFVRFAPQATGSPVTVYSSTDSVFNPQYQIIKIENDYIIPFLDQYNWFSSNTVPFDEDLNEYYDSIYNSGYQQGLQDGDAGGYDKGYTDGYQVGHAHGASESYQEFNVVYTFLAPVRSFLETPLFGSFSFGDAFAVFFAVAIGVIFIKMFSGG